MTTRRVIRGGLWRLGWAIAALTVLCAGCGSTSRQTAAAGTSSGHSSGTVHVVMKALEFTPTTVHAKVGQEVTWTNEDTSPHNVTYVSGPQFRSSRPVLHPGATFSVTPTQPGTIHYYCSIHPWMKATIVVSP